MVSEFKLGSGGCRERLPWGLDRLYLHENAQRAVSPLLQLAAPATDPVVPRARIRSCRSPRLAFTHRGEETRSQLPFIGLDIHKDLCEVAVGEGTRAGPGPGSAQHLRTWRCSGRA